LFDSDSGLKILFFQKIGFFFVFVVSGMERSGFPEKKQKDFY